MNKLLATLSAAFLVTLSAFADQEVAHNLVRLKVTKVESLGKILKRNHSFPVEAAMVGIPVTVTFPNACTEFAGQTTYGNRIIARPSLVLEALGSQNPMQDFCIEVIPQPKNVLFTLKMNRQGMFASESQVLKQIIGIEGVSYLVRADLWTSRVTIDRIFTTNF